MKNKLFGIAFGVMLMGGALIPSVASASTLTAPQVSAIIGLLQAFGVDPQTIAIVEAQLAPTPTSVSSNNETVQQPAPTVQSTGVAQPPTCALSVRVDPLSINKGNPEAIFGWTFTPGSFASLKATNGSARFVGTVTAPDSHNQLLAGAYISATTNFEMDVTLNSLTGSCSATATI